MAYKLHVVVKVFNGKRIWIFLGLGGQRLLDDELDGRIIFRVRLAVEKSACVSHGLETGWWNEKAGENKQAKTSRRSKRSSIHSKEGGILTRGQLRAYLIVERSVWRLVKRPVEFRRYRVKGRVARKDGVDNKGPSFEAALMEGAGSRPP